VPVAAEIQPLLDQVHSVEVDMAQVTPEMLRAGLDAMWTAWWGDAPDVVTEERVLAGYDGAAHTIPLRIYRPRTNGPWPVVVYLHGGGFVVGSVECYAAHCRSLCDRADAVLVSVDYRLAPEHPFPAGSDDCLAAVRWTADACEELGSDGRLVVAGDSAGGNLTAVTALRARDEGGPPLSLQVIVYPCLDPSCSTESHDRNGRGHLLTTDTMRWFWSHYLGDGTAPDDPYVDPRCAPSLEGLPPAVVVTAEYDPLRDEGAEYARLLGESGVAVDYVDEPGMVHGYFSMFAVSPRAVEATERVAAAIRGCEPVSA
jgi:acetyl esterase